MNYYFLTEDEKSLHIILPDWLDYMNFGCNKVENYQKLQDDNSYVLASSHGVDQLENRTIYKTIDTIKEQKRRVDKLVILIDSEDKTVEYHRNKILTGIDESYGLDNIPCEIKIFVIEKCFETWLLGKNGIYSDNKNLYSQNVHKLYNYYNIEHQNPELMERPDKKESPNRGSDAKFHFQYLHTMLNELSTKMHNRKFRYMKSKPGHVKDLDYFNGIVERIKSSPDLISFKEFYNFIVEEGKLNNKTEEQDTP